MADNDFEDNWAHENGGGLGIWHAISGAGGSVRVLRGHYYRNRAATTGGAVRVYAADVTSESVTYGSGGTANTPDDITWNNASGGSLTII